MTLAPNVAGPVRQACGIMRPWPLGRSGMRVGICQRVTALVITAALLAITAGITFAAIPDASGVFHACMLKGAGTLRIIDPALPRSDLRSHCTAFETEITWGSRGTTVTAIPVPSGNAFCPAGGTQFTVGTIVTYACNGTAGTNGAAGSVAGLAGTPCVTQAGAAGTLSVATGEGDYILLRCGTAVQPPAVAVSNVTAFAIASNLMILHWDPVPSAT